MFRMLLTKFFILSDDWQNSQNEQQMKQVNRGEVKKFNCNILNVTKSKMYY